MTTKLSSVIFIVTLSASAAAITPPPKAPPPPESKPFSWSCRINTTDGRNGILSGAFDKNASLLPPNDPYKTVAARLKEDSLGLMATNLEVIKKLSDAGERGIYRMAAPGYVPSSAKADFRFFGFDQEGSVILTKFIPRTGLEQLVAVGFCRQTPVSFKENQP